MAHLSLHLLGPGVLALDGQALRPHSAKTLALLAFLVLESDRPHPRERLAALLWERLPEASARQGLRQALYSLKQLAGGRLQASLDASHDWVRFTPGAGIEVDVHRFLDGVRAADIDQWRAAAALYRAPLLDGRAFDDCEAYGQWLAAARERLHAMATHNLERLVGDRIAQADLDAARHHAEALRDLDPASEAAARHLFRVHAARNDPQAIDAEWARLRGLLQREFGAEPSRETVELRRALREGGGPVAVSTWPATPGRVRPPLRDPKEAEPFVRAARAAEGVYAFSQAADLHDRALRVLEQAGPTASRRRCEVLLLKEAALERLGRRAEQAETIGQVLSIAEGLGDDALVASVLLRRAGACAYLGRYDEARAAAERALAIHRGIGDQPGEAEALRELGFVHWHAQAHGAALQCARDALALHRRLGDVAGEATALHNLAEIHRDLGSPRQAIDWYEQALQLHWAARSHHGEILSLFGMAHALQQAGDLPGSTRSYREALGLSERHGERTMQSRALHALAMGHAEQGDLDAALGLMRRAIEVDRAIGYAHGLGHDLIDLARIHVDRGERTEARTALQEALVWFGFTEDEKAIASTRARICELDSDGHVASVAIAPRHGVKSHLALGEGKVYCEFESPLG